MSEIKNILQTNSIVMECLTELKADQPPRDRKRYIDIAIEATLSSSGSVGKSKLINQLYTDIISKSKIDFGKIPNSKGNLTAYYEYKAIAESIENINVLIGDKNIEELKLLNRLHDMIITARGDFEFGFKFDITIIMLTYNLLVLALFDMLNICIVMYVDYLKEIENTEFKFRGTDKRDIIVLKYVKDFLKAYDNGEWAKTVNQFKKDGSGLLGFITGGSIAGAPLVVVSLLTSLIIIRGLIYVYYNSSMKINDALRVPKEFLKESINAGDDNSTPIIKQKKMLSRLEGLSDFIETKILKTNKDAKKELQKSNIEKYDVRTLQDNAKDTGIELL